MSNDVIDEAQAPGTFDVLSFVAGTAYPSEEVTIYVDVLGAEELLKLNKQRLANDDKGVEDAKLDGMIEELSKQVKASALTFKLRGLPPGLVQELYTNVSDENATKEESETAEAKLIAATIAGVKNAQGAVDSRVWDEEAVTKLRYHVKEAEYGRLVKGVINVNFNATVFDQATDAGFLGGSSDVAG